MVIPSPDDFPWVRAVINPMAEWALFLLQLGALVIVWGAVLIGLGMLLHALWESFRS